MVMASLDALSRLRYDDFEVIVVDNNTEDPRLWQPVAEHCEFLGDRFRFFHVDMLEGAKAGALNYALRIPYGRDRQGDNNPAPILTDPRRFEVIDPLAPPKSIEDLRFLGPQIGRNENFYGPSDNLVGAIAKDSLSAGVPGCDDSFKRLPDNGVVRRFDDRSKPSFWFEFSGHLGSLRRTLFREQYPGFGRGRLCL